MHYLPTHPAAHWPSRAKAPQVEDFEEAERALRRHGVEYTRFVLPGGWVGGARLIGGAPVLIRTARRPGWQHEHANCSNNSDWEN